jgi:hypothetical protein
MAQQGQVQWNRSHDDKAVTTTLTLFCRDNGSIYMETPQSQGGYHNEFKSPQEVAQAITQLLDQGIGQVRSSS